MTSTEKDVDGYYKKRSLQQQADEYYREKNYEEALHYYGELLLLDPNNTSIHTIIHTIRGNAFLALKLYKEAYQSFESALKLFPDNAHAYLGKGKVLFELGRHHTAISEFNMALYLDSQIPEAYKMKGHACFMLEGSVEALPAYETAMRLGIQDADVYRNVAVIHYSHSNFEQARIYYEKSLQLNPEQPDVYERLGDILSTLNLYARASSAYNEAIQRGTAKAQAFLCVGDDLAAHSKYEEAESFYQKALSLAEKERNINVLWHLAHDLYVPSRPAHVQFALLYILLARLPSSGVSIKAYWDLGILYDQCFNPEIVSSKTRENYIYQLCMLFQQLPLEQRRQALIATAHEDPIRLAHFLIIFAPNMLQGLDACARALIHQWKFTAQYNTLAFHLYQILSEYSVPQDEKDFFYIRLLMHQQRYEEAEPLLLRLAQPDNPSPEILWLLVIVFQHCKRPVSIQIEFLNRFIASASGDHRLRDAWLRLGDLYSLIEDKADDALRAYRNAEQLGASVPALQAFRKGNWDTVPALRSHKNFPFPVVVVIDLENDYQPDAAPGSRVFEIGAVRMKGSTELEHYNRVILRNFVADKVAKRQDEAQEQQLVVDTLQEFIGTAIVVGHNLQAFDALHLRGMGLSLADDQIIDTLLFARLLYPDSIHHHLKLLCEQFESDTKRKWHNALDDARACADLLHALGKELVRRGETLVAGFRAFTIAGSAFDRAVLQPRGIPADPLFAWQLTPYPEAIHALARLEETPASPKMKDLLGYQADAIVERYDPDAAYVQFLPANQRCIVTVSSRARLERMLAHSHTRKGLFVLPHPHTLLCPHRLRQCIEKANTSQEKLTLFCLYQASHNHDARTLYPLRLPVDEDQPAKPGSVTPPSIQALRATLLSACCGNDLDHISVCPAFHAAKQSLTVSSTLYAIHENFIAMQAYASLKADLIIIDDADELQMHFAEYLTERVDSDFLATWQLNAAEIERIQGLQDAISTYARDYVSHPGHHERIPLRALVPDLTKGGEDGEKTVLSLLEEAGPAGEQLASKLKLWCSKAVYDYPPDGVVRATWLDLWFSVGQETTEIERWNFCHLDHNLQRAFQELFWQPFASHLICGTAMTLGNFKETFLVRYFGLKNLLPFLQDERPQTKVLIPTQESNEEMIGPASFLRRRSWALEVGRFLYRWMTANNQPIMLTLHETSIAHAIADAFQDHHSDIKHQILSTHLHWSTSKIAERLTNAKHLTLSIIAPPTRRTMLDMPVAVEATGSLRFLNRRDPLVAAQMRAFAHLYPDEGPLNAYLLPQALLELKVRLASPAQTHIILDSSLCAKVYRNEVFSLMNGMEKLETLPPMVSNKQPHATRFTRTLSQYLELHGFHAKITVANEDLLLTLQALWETKAFRSFDRVDGTTISQNDIAQNILSGKDQLVVIATGGGKSLCFQLPAVLMAEDVVPRVTLIISPLVALMQDQVQKLRNKGIFTAVLINSHLSESERLEYLSGIGRGDYSIVYIAPEQIRSRSVVEALKKREISLIAIDEAHCVSQWGHDFRPDYFALKQWMKTELCGGQPRHFPLVALTATARQSYQGSAEQELTNETSTIRDIIEKLELHVSDEQTIIGSPGRSELDLLVEPIRIPCSRCQSFLEYSQSKFRCPSCGLTDELYKEKLKTIKREKLIELLKKDLRHRWERSGHTYQRGIIYCRTTLVTEELAAEIEREIAELQGKVAAYHGKMAEAERKNVYTRFIEDGENGLRVVVATNAFGMGIDAARLGFVVHYDVPATPEAYYQEAGRAGRNFKKGEFAQCILFYHDADLEGQRWLMDQNKITEADVSNVYQALHDIQQKRHDTGDLLVTEEEVAYYAGVEAEQIDVLFYYLEYHATIGGRPVIRRGENISHTWQVRFAEDYQKYLNSSLSDIAQKLLALFHAPGEYHFSTQEKTRFSLNALAQSLQQHSKKHFKFRELEDGLADLVRKGILTRATHGHLEWKRTNAEILSALTQLEHDLMQFIEHIPEQKALQSKRKVYVNINSLVQRHALYAVPLQNFIHFLFTLSQHEREDMQIFDHFKISVRHAKPGWYCIRLHQPGKEYAVIKKICQQLRRTVEQVRNLDPGEQQTFDLLRVTATYEERRRLRQYLFWLDILGLLSYLSEPGYGQARRIHILQEAAVESLQVDLSSLYIQEAYKDAKLLLMQKYARTSKDERAPLFKSYFLGAISLLEPYRMSLRLTDEQRQVIVQSHGYHLTEGAAGTGKTTVLLEHIKYLMGYLHLPARRIIVFAHNKSAVEKIHHAVETDEFDMVGRQLPEMVTLHAFANRIFKDNCALLKRNDGLSYYHHGKHLTLLTDSREIQEKKMVIRALKDLKSKKLEQTIGLGNIDSQLGENANGENFEEKIIRQCLQSIYLFRQSGIFPQCNPPSDEIEHALTRLRRNASNDYTFYYAVYVTYLELMGEANLYTYDDQILFAFALLKQYPYLRNQYNRYEHIVIDEFQDLTPAEINFLQLLAHKHHNLFAAGDSGQGIRVASVEFTDCQNKFQRLADPHHPYLNNLTNNFRTATEILRFLNAIRETSWDTSIKRRIAIAYNLQNEKLKVIEVPAPTSQIEQGYDKGKISERLLCTMLQVSLDQQRLLEITTGRNAALIVARSSWISICEDYLNNHDIPFALLTNNSRYQAPHIAHILLYFYLIADVKRDYDTKRLLRFCLNYDISYIQIKQLETLAQEEGLSLMEILRHQELAKEILSQEQRAIMQEHLELIQRFFGASSFEDVWQALSRLEQGPIVTNIDLDERARDQEQLREELKRYTVQQALEQIKRRISFINEHSVSGTLTLTTIDHAKSQEFDTVFLLGADTVPTQERFYVSVSRAKQQLCLLVNAQYAHTYRQLASELINVDRGIPIDDIL